MNSEQKILLKLLDGKNVFQLPVYQRNYNWESKHVERFLEDIEAILNGRDTHFFGVFVGIEKSSSFVDRKTLIDGQQRLTTTMIFLKALHDFILDQKYDRESEANSNKNLATDIMTSYLTNNLAGKDRVKLQLLGVDRENYLRLLENPTLCDQNSRIKQNYSTCRKKIAEWIKWEKKTPQEIFDTLAKIQVIYLKLFDGEDDPQLIFESINSTGLDLAKSDLIRNFLLMGIQNRDEQERLFKEYWLKIADENLHRDNDSLEKFFTHYVTYKLEISDVKSENLYEKFKSLCEKSTHEEILIELEKFSQYFRAFVYFEGNYSETVFKYLRALSELKHTTCFPFLFHLFEDFSNQVIDESTLEKVLKLIVSYYVQTQVCGNPTSKRREFFITLHRRVFIVESNKKKYFEAVKKFMCKIQTTAQLPSNENFFDRVQEINLFYVADLCKFLLKDINGGNIDGLKPAIILPKNLEDGSWNISSEDHEKYRYRLGNCTLVSHDKPSSSFPKKKDIYNEDSTSELNFDVVNQVYWGIDQIESRGNRLAQILLKHFNVDRNFDAEIVFTQQQTKIKTISLDDWKNIDKFTLLGYNFRDVSHEVKSWKRMFEEILVILDEKYSKELDSLADVDGKYPKITRNQIDDTFEIHHNLYADTNLDPQLVILSIQSLFQHLNLSKNLISFTVAEK